MPKIRLRKSGDSLVFTIPPIIAEMVEAGEGSNFTLDVKTEEKTLIFRKVE